MENVSFNGKSIGRCAGWRLMLIMKCAEKIYQKVLICHQKFVDQLINLTLKTDLPNQMKAKNLGDMNFGFALVTGIGGVTAGKKLWTDKGQILMEKGKAFDIHTILCGLASLLILGIINNFYEYYLSGSEYFFKLFTIILRSCIDNLFVFRSLLYIKFFFIFLNFLYLLKNFLSGKIK